MAFVLVVVGLLMIVTGAKGTYSQFGAQVASDFTGSQPFTYWLAAIGIVGSLGYVEALRTFSRYFMALILLAMILANKGFFDQFTKALKTGPIAPTGGTGIPASSGASSGGIGSAGVGGGPNGTMSLKDSLTKPGGGGFWDYFNIPSPFGK